MQRSVPLFVRWLCTTLPIASIPAARSQIPKRKPNPSYVPWTPTHELRKKNHYFKRMGFLIQTLEKEKMRMEAGKHPRFAVGDVLRLKLRVPENANKEEEFVGLCIAQKVKGYRTSFTLRKTWTQPLGVERLFHLYSPSILAIEITGKKKFEGKNLYYLRDNTKATNV